MRHHRHQHHQAGSSKRTAQDLLMAEEEPVVDDLLIAAQYATLTLCGNGNRSNDDQVPHPEEEEPSSNCGGKEAGRTEEMDDENEICLEEDEAGESSKDEENPEGTPICKTITAEVREKNGKHEEERIDPATMLDPPTNAREESSPAIDRLEILNTNQPERSLEQGGNHDDDDDDDDESTVDLEAELARMTATEVDEDDEVGTASAQLVPPKTAHELEIASVPLEEVLCVVPLTEEWLPRFHAAGTLQHVLPEESSTVVIVQADPNRLLQEGSVVWIHQRDAEVAQAVSLGSIVEVFGPVRQPLYHVRLPSLPQRASYLTEQSNASPQPEPPRAASGSDPQGISQLQPTPPPEASIQPSQRKPPNSEPPDSVQLKAAPPPPQENAPKLILTLSMLESAARDHHPVYCVPDEAHPLDTAEVFRNSGRGCDASNWYDEEVVDAQQLDYSDDEQEREAKQRRNKRHHNHPDHRPDREPSRGVTRPPQSASRGGRGLARPRGFYHPHLHNPGLGGIPPPPPPPPRLAQNSQGFHVSHPIQSPSGTFQHPHYPHSAGVASPAHPFCPQSPHQPMPPHSQAPGTVQAPPAPGTLLPPIRLPPPCHQNGEEESDTIYYD